MTTTVDEYRDRRDDEDEIDKLIRGDSIGERFAPQLWKPGAKDFNRYARVDHLGILETRTTVTSSTGWGATQSPDMPTPAVPVRVGQLLDRLPTQNNAVAYVVESNVQSDETGATILAEGATKPEILTEFLGGVLPVKKFAAWVPATNEILEDVPGLQNYVDRILVARYLTAVEESEILDGDGTGDHMLGIRHTTGIQTQAFATSVAQTIADAINLVEIADGTVDAIAIHPTAYRLSQVANPTLWTEWRGEGIRVVKSKRVGVNKAVVGSWFSGGLIRERETVVRFSPDHASYFIQNKIALLAERREALIVRVPAWFVDVSLS